MSAVLDRFGTATGPYIGDYNAEPTCAKFHLSDAFIRGIRGPMGSGKSVACVMEMVIRAHQQAPDRHGKRRTRWGAIRNTYGELKTTTMKTFSAWVPESIAPINRGEPMTARMVLRLPDRTTVDMEVVFISCDKPADVGKLKSLDLTGLWLNEASELDNAILDMGTGRVGRYPEKKDAPFTWAGVIMDTNSMDDDHWWYGLAEGADDPDEQMRIDELKKNLREQLARLGMDRNLMAFFEQPPALLEAQGSYVPNPAAENVNGQPMGHAYWLLLVAGKAKEWVDIYVMNKYGKVIDGLACYNAEYDDLIHGAKRQLKPIDGKVIRIGLDFGLSPAAIPGQCSATGRLLVLGECVPPERSIGMTRFANDMLKQYLLERFGRADGNGDPWKYIVVGDPAGDKRSENDEVKGFQIVRDAGFDIEEAPTNNFSARRDAVAWFLNKTNGFAMDQSCIMLRKGFRGGYHYRRVQMSGPARYSQEAHSNKYTHPHDGLQYLALPYVAIEVPAYGMKAIPKWAQKMNSGAKANKPWAKRAGR